MIWEYKAIDLSDLTHECRETTMNALGNEGWEGFAVSSYNLGTSVMFFKRLLE